MTDHVIGSCPLEVEPKMCEDALAIGSDEERSAHLSSERGLLEDLDSIVRNMEVHCESWWLFRTNLYMVTGLTKGSGSR